MGVVDLEQQHSVAPACPEHYQVALQGKNVAVTLFITLCNDYLNA